MANTIEIVVRAVDEATRPLRDIRREVDALGLRLQQVGAALSALPDAAPRWIGAPPRTGGMAAQAAYGSAAQQTTVIQVMLPESALRDPGRAEAAGERFGEAIVRRLRERG